MNYFSLLTYALKNFILDMYIAMVFLSLVLVFYAYHLRMKTMHVITLIAWATFNCIMLIILWINYYTMETGYDVNQSIFSKYLYYYFDINQFDAPYGFYFVFLYINALLLLFALIQLRIHQSRHINYNSIKAAIDNLTTGICIYKMNGQVVMLNNIMNQLSIMLLGKELMDGNAFFKLLGEDDMIQIMPDQSVWHFVRKKLDTKYYQLMAYDITKPFYLNNQLEQQNKKLSIMNNQMKEYGNHVDEVVKEEENLASRISIHDELGQTLLASKNYLVNGKKEDKDYLLHQWEETLDILINDKQKDTSGSAIQELMKAAESIGLKINIKGDMNNGNRFTHLFVSATRETMTNAIHGKATQMNISIEKDQLMYIITYTNNGLEPQYPVILGGGLSSLKALLEKENGELIVADKAPFFVQVRIPLV